MGQAEAHHQRELRRYGSCTLDSQECVTCGDTLVPVRVLSVDGNRAACEDRKGNRAVVLTDLVTAVSAGDILLVHAGVAMSALDSKEAIS